MGELGVLFNPGMRHEQEEKLAKQMLREDEGTGRKGRRGIDLESGVVVIGADDAPSAEPTDRDGRAGQSPAGTTARNRDDEVARDATHRDQAATRRDQPRAAPSRRRSGAAPSTPGSAQPVGKARRSR